jgi:hypothetical protein
MKNVYFKESSMDTRDTLVWLLGIIDGQKRYSNGSIEIDSDTRELIIDKILDIVRNGDSNVQD